MKVLVAGWFSFPSMGATAGDLMCRDVLCAWLGEERIPCDVALAPPFSGGVRWEDADPDHYTHVIFACGPCGNGPPLSGFLEHFRGCSLLGVNLSMLSPVEEWNPFDLLLERDSTRTSRPDLTLLSEGGTVPVVGLILVEPQPEYGKRARHREAQEAITAFLGRQRCAVVPVDTRLDGPNTGGLRSPEEIESVIARMDLVVTTRLHGMVLAIKNGIPALVVDAVEGGAKVTRQAESIGWPNVLRATDLDASKLRAAYRYCLTEEARRTATACRARGVGKLGEAKRSLVEFLRRDAERR